MREDLWSDARRIFEEILDADDETREQHLGRTDPEIAEFVRSLLAAHDRPNRSLEPPTGPELESIAPPPTPTLSATDRIGSYRLLHVIGTGGMGTVYEARQEEPSRIVALKVMHTDLTNPTALRRFRFESEVLARLRHPGIAQVFEAGLHEDASGIRVPWFAMEHVSAHRTIVQYGKQLDLEARLRLFVRVCDAVHYGHQRGVIHRDLKPSNILVDDTGAPKIIDFGIARTTGSDVAATRFTMTGEIVGTLGAMSPEQLSGSDADVDTRTDIYALGALLYELVAERPPFDFSNTPLPRAIRRICVERPPPPGSVRSGIPPELDWVVGRAMAADRDERFASASELAADLERFLADEPVLAGPPTAGYRMRKFIRRHRWAVGGLATLLIGLVLALVWITSIYLEAERERSKTAAINQFLTLALSSADPVYDGPDARVIDVLDRTFELSASTFAKEPEIRASLLRTVGCTYHSLGQYDRAREYLEESVRIHRELKGPEAVEGFVSLHFLGMSLLEDERERERAVDLLREAHAGLERHRGAGDEATLRAEHDLGIGLMDLGDFEGAEDRLRHSLAAWRDRNGDLDPTTIRFLGNLAHLLEIAGEYEEAETLFQRAIAIGDELGGPDHVDWLGVRNNYAGLLLGLGRYDEAKGIMEQAHEAAALRAGVEHPLTLRLATSLAQTMIAGREIAEARALFETTLETLIQVRGELNPLTLDARMGLGTVLYFQQDFESAERQLRLAMEGFEVTLGPDDERVLQTRNNVAMLLQSRGAIEEAEKILRRNLASRRRVHGDRHPDTLGSLNNLGFLLLQAGRGEEARPLLEEALAGRREVLGLDHRGTLTTAVNLADLHQRAGRPAEAIPLWREVLAHGEGVFADDGATLGYVEGRLAEALAGLEDD